MIVISVMDVAVQIVEVGDGGYSNLYSERLLFRATIVRDFSFWTTSFQLKILN